MDCRLVGDRVEDAVDRLRGKLGVFGSTRKVGLVDLDASGLDGSHLRGQDVGEREGQSRLVAIVGVEQHAREHVRAGQREFDRVQAERRHPVIRLDQVQGAFANRPLDNRRGALAKAEVRLRTKEVDVGPADFGPDPVHLAHEVLDHPVRLRVVRVEAVQLAIDHEVDAGELLNVQDHRSSVFQRLLARVGDQPRGDGIAAHQRGEDAGRAHGSWTYWMRTPSGRRGSTMPTTVPLEPRCGAASTGTNPLRGASASAAATSSTFRAR